MTGHRHLIEVWLRPGFDWRWACRLCWASDKGYASLGHAADDARRHGARVHGGTR